MSDGADDEDKMRLITFTEASKLYGLSTTYLRAIARKGRLKAQKVGSIWLTTPNNIEEYILSRDERGAFRDDIQLD